MQEEHQNPAWLSDGFLVDSWNKRIEPFRRPMEDFPPFLWTGRQPQVGMQHETDFNMHGGRFFKLSGFITQVGNQPSDEMIRAAGRAGTSTLFKPGTPVFANRAHLGMLGYAAGPISSAQGEFTEEDRAQNFQLSKEMCLQHLGALPGQTIKGYGRYSNPSEYGFRELGLDYRQDQLFEIVWEFNDRMENKWTVRSLRPVMDEVDFASFQAPNRMWREYRLLRAEQRESERLENVVRLRRFPTSRKFQVWEESFHGAWTRAVNMVNQELREELQLGENDEDPLDTANEEHFNRVKDTLLRSF